MKTIITLSLLLLPFISHAQHNMNMKGMQHKETNAQADTSSMDDMDMGGMEMSMDSSHRMNMPPMSHALSLNLPMQRDGSGTGWLPDDAPMYGYMKHAGKWMFMFHGNVFIRYNKQDLFNAGHKGNDKWDAPDYFMAMGQRQVGKHGLFHLNAMFSLDALVQGGSGYPLLFQTGESWHGVPLVDRQHPHDLFCELSASYAYSFSKKSDLSVYIGYPGEPALGSVAFMHRPSAMFDPDAPISHHWNDGTHITFGVATLGYRYGKFKIEASSFTGREPDENRYNFDKPTFDSWSSRLSFNPSAHWALQISHGYIKSPEALRPDEDVNRTTASATYSYPFGRHNFFDATALWGLNKTPGQDGSNAALIEANLKLHKLALYTRYEWVQKSGEELNLNDAIYNPYTLHPVNTLTVGAGYDLFKVLHTIVAAGAQLSVYHADAMLDGLYGKNPVAAEIYLHIYPGMMH